MPLLVAGRTLRTLVPLIPLTPFEHKVPPKLFFLAIICVCQKKSLTWERHRYPVRAILRHPSPAGPKAHTKQHIADSPEAQKTVQQKARRA